MFRVIIFCLTFIITTAVPLHQLETEGGAPTPFTDAKQPPIPTPTPLTTLDAPVEATPLPMENPSEDSPIPDNTAQETPSPTPENTLLPLGFDGDPDEEPGDSDLDDDPDSMDDGPDGDENSQQSDGDFKSADAVTAPASISALALAGIAVAILAPAVLIYWLIRRRNQAGFENMPEAEENTYRGPGRDTFTVA